MTRLRMPAVSMKRQVRPPSWISSSTGSTVVPAASSTTARSSLASLLSSEDLPTLGLPTMATRRGPPSSPRRSGGVSGQRGEDRVEHVAGAAAVQRRDRVGLPQPEVPQPEGLGLGALVVDLVGGQHDRLAGLAQHLDDGLVVVGDPDGGVHHEEHRVGDLHRDLGLGPDAQGEALRVGVPAAGVDDGEGAAVPVGVVGHPVAGHAGDVLDDGLAPTDDPVDQGGLAHVGSADHGQHGNHFGRGAVGADRLGCHVPVLRETPRASRTSFSVSWGSGPGSSRPVRPFASTRCSTNLFRRKVAVRRTSAWVRGHGCCSK